MGVIINLKADTGLVDRTENTVRFYDDIKKYNLLSKEDETRLFEQYKHGTEAEKIAARDALINCNQRLVVAAAKKYATTDTLMDYVDEANMGLIEAIESFDPSKGVRLQSYAMFYIKRAINEYNNKYVPIVKKTNLSKTFSVIAKATNKFLQENERNPTEDELMELINDQYLAKDIKDKNDLLDLKTYRIDEACLSEDEFNYNEMSEYHKYSAVQNECVSTQNEEYNKTLISSLLSILSPREQDLIKMKFGLYEKDGYFNREYETVEISEELGITTERVRQMEKSIMERLQREYAKRIREIV